MKACVISFKDCWQDHNGEWLSYGGFPAQMTAIGSLFDAMTLVIVEGQHRSGGIPLPKCAKIIPLKEPTGVDFRRKLSVLSHLSYYLRKIIYQVRQADVVHVPVPGDIAVLGMFVALYFRKRLIARYCSSWAPNSNTTFMNRITKLVMRRSAGKRNVMLATGAGDAPPARDMNWIFATALSKSEIERITPDLSRGLSKPPRLVYIGRLSFEKGVSNLVNAIGRLNHSGYYPAPSVTIIGDGPERIHLESLVQELGCSDRISFTGQADREVLSEHLIGSDICVQPSLTEGYSKAWLDAMVHGLPVLSTDVGAAKYVIGSNNERGWLVPPNDIDALFNKLQEILSAPVDWLQLRRRCKEYADTKTLESWAEIIGLRCAQQWNLSLEGGKLRG